MPRIKPIRQHDQSDCGAACLASVAAFYGLHLPLSRIREYASTGRNGTNIMGLIEAAEKIGMTAKGVKGPCEALLYAPLPCIAHIITADMTHHFIVLASCGRKKIRYMDPAQGKMISVSHEEFCRNWSGILVILAPGTGFEKGNRTSSMINRYIQLIRPFRNMFIQALTGALVYSLLGLSTAIYVQKIMDFVLVSQNLNLLNLLSLAMILILFLRCLVGYLKNLFLLKTGHQIDSGLLMGAIKIRHFINHFIIDLVVGLSSIIFTLLAMSILSWKLCLMVATAIPLYSLIIYIYDRFNRVILRKTMENAADLEAQMVESISSSRSVREFSLQGYCIGKTELPFIGFLRSSYQAGRAAIRSNQATELISSLLTVILLWVGSGRVCRQFLTPGELMSFYTMLGYLLGPVAILTGSSRSVRDAGIAADRLFQIMDLEREKNSDTGIRISEFNTSLEFRNVDFSYGSRPPVFSNLSFTIRAGSFTGITGKNGCGKSSLASLLMALYHPRKGKILVDGLDIKHLNTHDLRSLISIVPQHLDLFSGTLLENIAPGEKKPDMRKILELAGKTGLDQLLNILPDGVYTRIGERGFNLSGGERQRMAIVRALYRAPSVLILDEATSAMDPGAEEIIFSLLDVHQRNGMTLIIISHKLRSVIQADQILFLDHGRVAEQGTHAELVGHNGEYFQFWDIQNG